MKKLVCLVMILALLFTGTISAYANSNQQRDTIVPIITEAQILKEIELEHDKVMRIVYEQLKLQGKLDHMDDYAELLLPEIEISVRMKYTDVDTILSTQDSELYGFAYGGSIANTTVSGRSALATYLDKDNSYYYILTSSSFKAGTIVEAILGALPKFGPIFSVLFTVRTLATQSAYDSILEADGYAKILTLQGTDNSSVVLGWDIHPYARPYALAEGTTVQAEAFPYHNPFES